MKYLVDPDWLIDSIAKVGSARVTLEDLMKDGVAVSIVTPGEVFEGAFSSVDPQAELDLFRRYFLAFAVVPNSAGKGVSFQTLIFRSPQPPSPATCATSPASPTCRSTIQPSPHESPIEGHP